LPDMVKAPEAKGPDVLRSAEPAIAPEAARIDKPSVFASLRGESTKPAEAVTPIERIEPLHTEHDPIAVRPIVSSELSEDTEDVPSADRRSWLPKAGVAAAAALILLAGGFGASKLFSPRAATVSTGTVSITTVPPGAQVAVDGQARGVTPLTVALPPGAHTLELRGNGEPRTIPISVSAGQQIAQYVELGKAAATLGKLQIRSEPAGAQVIVDGNDRGKSPVLVDALAPGEHTVVLQSDVATVKQTVTIEAGETAAVVVPLTATEGAPVSGWVSVKAPVELQLYENKNLVGTTQSDRIMVSAGKHDLELVNEPLGYRVTRTVQVAPGKVATIAVNWPTGTLAINAQPWADVTVDGNPVGQTPIGNLTLPIGPHEIVFRHPDLGEQRQAVSLSLKAPARVSVDMRKKP